MIKIDINNRVNDYKMERWMQDLFEKIAKKAGEKAGYEKGIVSVSLVNNHQIKELNQQFRDIDQPTDVLSFPMDEEIWGDVIISLERAKSQAEEYGHSWKREVGFLFTHGVLHLLGYDHKEPESKKKMRSKEEEILSELDLSR